ncbi:MAG: NUDIX hydrolase [Bacteroidetes bacterium]|nr:NUDIX hydrolase [Bacteroidota bacterium]
MKSADNEVVKLIADVTVFHRDKVLLLKYSDTNKYDHQDGWFLPDDLVPFGMHPEDKAAEIMSEQLGIKGVAPKIDHIESFTGNDGSWHLVFHFRYISAKIPELKPSQDIKTVKWFSLKELPPKKEVAHHGWALYTILSMTVKEK